MFWAFLPAGVLALAYWLAAWKEWRRACAIMKPGLVLTVALGYLLCARPPVLWVLGGQLAGWTGDVFLMKGGEKSLQGGIAAFLLGHLLYMVALALRMDWAALPWGLAGLSALGLFSIGLVIFVALSPNLGGMKPLCGLYILIIFSMCWMTLNVLLAAPGCAGLLLFVGGLCFVASDTLLAWAIFRQLKWKRDFLVMSFYTLAQLCLGIGFALQAV